MYLYYWIWNKEKNTYALNFNIYADPKDYYRNYWCAYSSGKFMGEYSQYLTYRLE